MPPGRPPKRTGESSELDTPDGQAKCKISRLDRSAPNDFSSVVKSKLQSYTRTGQACDRCKVRSMCVNSRRWKGMGGVACSVNGRANAKRKQKKRETRKRKRRRRSKRIRRKTKKDDPSRQILIIPFVSNAFPSRPVSSRPVPVAFPYNSNPGATHFTFAAVTSPSQAQPAECVQCIGNMECGVEGERKRWSRRNERNVCA